MSDFIRVICNSTEPLPSCEIADFITEGVYFDEAPRFDPPRETADTLPTEWQTLAVFYQANRTPILFHKSVNDRLMLTEVEEIVAEELAGKQTEAARILSLRLSRGYQTLAIEINPTSLTEEAWEMLDSIEAYIATKYEGIIYVPDDGFFDASLQRIDLT